LLLFYYFLFFFDCFLLFVCFLFSIAEFLGYVPGEYVKVVVDMCERQLSFHVARDYDYTNMDRRKVEPEFKLLTLAQIPEKYFPEAQLFASVAAAYVYEFIVCGVLFAWLFGCLFVCLFGWLVVCVLDLSCALNLRNYNIGATLHHMIVKTGSVVDK
jgi:hypothetical protein